MNDDEEGKAMNESNSPGKDRGFRARGVAAGVFVAGAAALAVYVAVTADGASDSRVAGVGPGGEVAIAPAPLGVAAVALTETQARGRTLYEANCLQCHGAGGLGDGPLAAGLPVRPVNVLLHLDHHTDEELVRIVTNGLPPAMPAMAMAASDVLAVFDYLRTLVPPGGGMNMNMPMGQGMMGQGMTGQGMPMGQRMPMGGSGSVPAEP